MRRRTKGQTQRLEGHVRGLTHAGEGAVETSAGIVLVAGALPGERVAIRAGERRRGARRGRLLSVLSAAAERVEPACPLQPRCGGCPLMVWSESAQAMQKRRWVADAVAAAWPKTPQAADARSLTGLTGGPATLGYRRRARLSFRAGAGGTALGYREAASHRVLDVPACPVLVPALGECLSAVRAQLVPQLVGEGELSLGLGTGGRPVLRLVCRAPQPPSVYAILRALQADGTLAGATLADAEAGSEARFGDPGEVFPVPIEIRASGTLGPAPAFGAPAQGLLRGAVGGFGQANDPVNRALIAWVVQAAAPAGRRVLELYAGQGNFTLALARAAAELWAVEQHPGAAAACRDNLRAAGLSGRVITADLPPLPTGVARRGKVDVVVLDPPRTGARALMPELIALAPETIVYVSCDPPTLHRDLGALATAGYVADRAQAFDMFPHTAHVEAAVRLVAR